MRRVRRLGRSGLIGTAMCLPVLRAYFWERRGGLGVIETRAEQTQQEVEGEDRLDGGARCLGLHDLHLGWHPELSRHYSRNLGRIARAKSIIDNAVPRGKWVG